MTVGLGLFSGGLDSILASRLLLANGLEVRTLRFVTPFFGYELLADRDGYAAKIRKDYGIQVEIRDISEQYLTMLANPPHGYGKNFNPCIDCKILLLMEAKRLMQEFSASFLFTGEVIGQRPMSQRKDTLRQIEKESGCEGILLRPLCAKKQPPTLVEESGLVDRNKLLDFSGRSRQAQRELAAHFGISDYPTPAGGCVLTDPVLSKRVALYYAVRTRYKINEVRQLLLGRQFELPGGGWLSLGRDEQENRRIASLHHEDEQTGILLAMKDRAGPIALLRYAGPDDLQAAAGLVARFGKKVKDGPATATIVVSGQGEDRRIQAEPLDDRVFKNWYR